MDKKKLMGHASVLSANIFFGLGVPVSALLLSRWVTPMGFMASRSLFAALIFWAIAAMTPKEKVRGADLAVIIVGGVMGFVVSQTLTAWALVYTTPVYFSFVAALTPVVVMLMAALLIGEKVTPMKTAGVIVGITGALLMAIGIDNGGSGSNDPLGVTLALLSVITWGLYLIITRKVSGRYSPVTQMKWVFLVSSVICVPWSLLGGGPGALYDGSGGGASYMAGIAEMAFIVIFCTAAGFFLIPFAMKYIGATTVSVYTNLQTVVAAFTAIIIGQDRLTWDKPAALVLVLLSAYIVTATPAAGDSDAKGSA